LAAFPESSAATDILSIIDAIGRQWVLTRKEVQDAQ
jgi:hypothetical protein